MKTIWSPFKNNEYITQRRLLQRFFDNLSDYLGEAVPSFNKKAFLDLIFNETWDRLELKLWMRHITLTLGDILLPKDFQQSARYIEALIYTLKQRRHKKQVKFENSPSKLSLPENSILGDTKYPSSSIEKCMTN